MDAELAYLFRHALLRDAAYQLQLPGVRAELHAMASVLMEEIFGPLDESLQNAVAAEIALHAGRGREGRTDPGLLDRERTWTRRAAEHADRTYRSADAVLLWESLAQIETGAARVEALRQSGAGLARSGRLAEAERRFRETLSEAGELKDDGARLRPFLDLGMLLRNTGRFAEAEPMAREAAELADRLNAGAVQALALENLGTILGMIGRAEDAERELKKAVACDSGEHRGMSIQSLATFHWQGGDFAEARRRFDEALELLRRQDDRRNLGTALSNLAGLLHSQEKFEEAEKTYRESLAMTRETGDRRSEGIVLGNLGMLCTTLDRLSEAEAHLRRSLQLCREVSNRRYEGTALGAIAMLCLRTSRPEEAESCLDSALSLHRATGNARFEGVQLCQYALELLPLGHVEQARKRWLQGAGILERVDTPANLEEVRRSMRDACAESGIAPFST